MHPPDPPGAASPAGLRVRLLALVLLCVLPALALLALTAVRTRGTLAEQVEDSALRLARLSASRHEAAIEGARQLLTGIARAPEFRSGDQGSCGSFLRDLHSQFPNYTGFSTADLEGNITCSSIPLPGPVNVSDRAYFREAVATRSFSIGDFATGRASGRPTIGFGIPILDASGAPSAIAIASLSVGAFESFAAEANLPPGSAVVVIDGTGTILARTPDALGVIGKRVPESALVQGVLDRRQGVVQVSGLDGVERLYGFVRLREGGDVSVAIGIDTGAAFAGTNRTFWLALAGLGVVAALAVAAGWFFGTRIVVQPVQSAIAREHEVAERLGQLDRMRSDFVSMVSHELRNPLATIRGFGQLLRDRPGALPGEQRQQAYDVIVRQVDRMASLVENVLDVSRLESDTFTYAFISYEPGAVVDESIEATRAAWPERDISLESDGVLESGTGDPDRLKQVMGNLLSNACQYSDEGTPIVVHARTEAGMFRVEVVDRGPGIPDEAAARLFQRFTRMGVGGSPRGTGLGLYISRRIVEAHGGRIWVTGEPGQGSTFAFEIPLDPPRQGDDAAGAA